MLDLATACSLLEDHLPGARGRLTFLGSGDFCFAFRFGERVVRIARHAEAAAALRREACALAAIADALPLPVPRLTYHSPGTCPPFTMHDEITGEMLTREAWTAMPPVAREKAASDMAGFLKALHDIPVELVLECGLARLDAVELARRLRREAAEMLHALLDEDSQRRLDSVLAQWSSPQPPRGTRPVLLHCDISPGHLLYDPVTGGLTGVIDFGDIAVGDPARDFIYIYEDLGTEMLTEVLSRYGGEDATSLLREMHKWYLLEAMSWTLGMYAAKRGDDVEEGLVEIVRELEALPAQ